MNNEENNVYSEYAEAMNTMVQWIIDAFAPLAKACVESAQIFAEALEDAMRDNSLHPTGPVVSSTAFPLPNDAPKIPVVSMIAEEARSFQEYDGNEDLSVSHEEELPTTIIPEHHNDYSDCEDYSDTIDYLEPQRNISHDDISVES